MTNPNPENPTEESPDDTAPDAVQAEVRPDTNPPPQDSRRRLRELLSVPERDRSDELWDEIIELEIQLAPGNRIGASDPAPNPPRRHSGGQQGRQGRPGGAHASQNNQANSGGGQAADAAGQPKKHRPRTKTNRRPRQNKPGDGGAGGSSAA
ncbi:MAG: hypothetical protein PHT48_10555 [Dechloromonas sp.]|nr:hypothetical protein [Dechloromonas sp.]